MRSKLNNSDNTNRSLRRVGDGNSVFKNFTKEKIEKEEAQYELAKLE